MHYYYIHRHLNVQVSSTINRRALCSNFIKQSYSKYLKQSPLLHFSNQFLEIMGAQSHVLEITSSVSAEKIFKGIVLEVDTVLPKAAPGAYKNVEIVGDGGAGTIRNITLADGKFYIQSFCILFAVFIILQDRLFIFRVMYLKWILLFSRLINI